MLSHLVGALSITLCPAQDIEEGVVGGGGTRGAALEQIVILEIIHMVVQCRSRTC